MPSFSSRNAKSITRMGASTGVEGGRVIPAVLLLLPLLCFLIFWVLRNDRTRGLLRCVVKDLDLA